jgi:excisionase family DNA binding protein
MTAHPPLFRPSQLARFWELHPKTVYTWIREGRLPAVRTPGDQLRLRVADVRAFCEARGLAVPPSAREAVRLAYVVFGAPATTRSLRRALRAEHVDVHPFPSALEAILACVAEPPALLALDAAARGLRIDDAVSALRRSTRGQATPVLVFGVPSAAKAEALVEAGATKAIVRGQDRAMAAAITDIFA